MVKKIRLTKRSKVLQVVREERLFAAKVEVPKKGRGSYRRDTRFLHSSEDCQTRSA